MVLYNKYSVEVLIGLGCFTQCSARVLSKGTREASLFRKLRLNSSSFSHLPPLNVVPLRGLNVEIYLDDGSLFYWSRNV